MSVELDLEIRHQCSDRRHAASRSSVAWRLGCGSRDERRDEHGISHFLEHMAFKGHAAAHRAPDRQRIEAVGGDLNATGAESTAYYARARRTCRALDDRAKHLSEPASAERAGAGAEASSSGDRRGGRYARRPDFEYLNEIAFPSQPLGRSDPRTAKTVRSFDDGKLRDYLGRITRPGYRGCRGWCGRSCGRAR